MTFTKGQMLYEGKAKKVYQTEKDGLFLVEYKDSATAFNGLKKDEIENKGLLNNQIASLFFQLLEQEGIPTHFVQQISEREMLVKGLEILPVEFVVRNVVAGSLAKRIGQPEGTPLAKPVLEFYYKDDELGDPMINEYHVYAMDWAEPEQIQVCKELSLQVNQILKGFMDELNIQLVDFKLEFGVYQGQVILGDEISPDTCRF